MRFKSRTKFLIKSLNQERILNELSSSVTLYEIDRKSKELAVFTCDFRYRKQVKKFLLGKNVEILKMENLGLGGLFVKFLSCYGVWSAIVVFSIVFFVQYQFVMRVEVMGAQTLKSETIANFIKENSSSLKRKIDTKSIEEQLMEEFNQISFASCIVKGQTLIVNIKEKLLPSQMQEDFSPIVATKNSKISKIDLISGTLCVSVGDYVKAGDVLVQPFVVDTSGNIKNVEAKATIIGEVYNESSIDHFDKRLEVKRTGKVAKQHEVTLFGLSIYNFSDDFDFSLYEVEIQEVDLSKGLFLPFVMKKTFIYEIEEVEVVEPFEAVEDKLVEKARENALKICEECDIILYEFHTTRQLAGVNIVSYCVVTQELIGGTDDY